MARDQAPLVSVITPFLNAEKFLEEAINSVLAQSYRPWELLLVDDGSSDGSTAIALEQAARHPNAIRYVEHAGHVNRGITASRNLGLAEARGDYVALLDADDVWLAHKLERQVCILEAHPDAAIVYGCSLYWKSWTGRAEDANADYIDWLEMALDRVRTGNELAICCYPLGTASPPCVSSLCFRRELAERVHGFEKDFTGIYELYEDQAWLMKVNLTANVYVAAECWDKYRQHDESAVARIARGGHYHRVREFYLRQLVGYLGRENVPDAAVWRAVRRALRPYRYKTAYKVGRCARQKLARSRYLRRICWSWWQLTPQDDRYKAPLRAVGPATPVIETQQRPNGNLHCWAWGATPGEAQ